MPVDARGAEIVALLNRINDLLVEFTATSSAKRQAAVKAELEAATDKLKRVALSFQNRHRVRLIRSGSNPRWRR